MYMLQEMELRDKEAMIVRKKSGSARLIFSLPTGTGKMRSLLLLLGRICGEKTKMFVILWGLADYVAAQQSVQSCDYYPDLNDETKIN